MRIQDEHITNTTITPSAEQRASGAFSKPVHQGPPSRFSQIGHFLWHFVQMCLACCIGGAALIGYPDLIQRFPELSTVVIAFLLALAAWMRFRGGARCWMGANTAPEEVSNRAEEGVQRMSSPFVPQ